jgi:hypothetical protein
MISNYIFNALAQDQTDSTAVGVLPTVQAKMRDTTITSSQVPDYAYISLKTLLGESANNAVNGVGIAQWAISRIHGAKNNIKFEEIYEPTALPLIFVQVTNFQQHPKMNSNGAFMANVEIGVFTNPENAASNISWSLIRRIHEQFVVYNTPQYTEEPKDLALGVTAIKGILNLFLLPNGIPISAWDVQKAQYIAQGRIIL